MDYLLIGKCVYGHQRLLSHLEEINDLNRQDQNIRIDSELLRKIDYIGAQLKSNSAPFSETFDYQQLMEDITALEGKLLTLITSARNEEK